MKTFETGKTYQVRSTCDSEMFFKETIVKRTAKTVWTASGKTLRVSANYDGTAEIFWPHGKYSMAPIMSADREVSEEAEIDANELLNKVGPTEFRKWIKETPTFCLRLVGEGKS